MLMHKGRPPWVSLWFIGDAIVALAPPLHWAVDGAIHPILGIPAVVFYFIVVGAIISASIMAAYRAEASSGTLER